MKGLSWSYSKPDGRQLNDKTGMALANLVNVFTFRWSPRSKQGKDALAGASTVIWAPSMYAARVQMLVGQPFYARGVDNRIRKIAAYQYLKAITGGLLLHYLTNFLMGGDDDESLEANPLSTDFAKNRKGDIRIDSSVGLGSTVVAVSRSIQGKKVTQKGDIVDTTLREQLSRFLGFKLKPWVQTIFNLWDKKDALGRPVTIASEAASSMTPISVQTAIEAFEEVGIIKGTPLAAVGITGRNISIYDPHAPKSEETFLATASRLARSLANMEHTSLPEDQMEKWMKGIPWHYDATKAKKFLSPEQMKQLETHIEQKKQDVVYNVAKILPPPNPKKFKGKEKYLLIEQEKYEKKTKKPKEQFAEMKKEVSYSEAQQLLADRYFRITKKKGTLDQERNPRKEDVYGTAYSSGSYPFKESYMARGKALAKLYGIKSTITEVTLGPYAEAAHKKMVAAKKKAKK